MQGEINITTWIILFCTYLVFDILYVLYIQAVNEYKALKASFLGVFMYLLTAYGTIEYISNFVNVIPIILGSFIGTFVTLKLGKRSSEKDS